MDEQPCQHDHSQAREEMINHDQWVSQVVPKIERALGDTHVEDLVKNRAHDRITNLVTFTSGILVEAEKAGRDGQWGYETVTVRLCAALYQLAELRNQVNTTMTGSRRSGHPGQ